MKLIHRLPIDADLQILILKSLSQWLIEAWNLYEQTMSDS